MMMVLSFIATLLLAAFIQVLIQQESHPMTSQPEQHNGKRRPSPTHCIGEAIGT